MKLIRSLILIYIIIIILINHIANGKTGDILIYNTEKVLESGKQWILSEDYTLTIITKDRYRVNISLSKNGDIVHGKSIDILVNPLYIGINNNTKQTVLKFYVQNIDSNQIQIKSIVQYSDGSVSPNPTPTATPILIPRYISTLVAKEKNLVKNENWNIGAGWALKAQSIDSKAKQVILSIYNNGNKVNERILNESDVYTYNNIFFAKIESIINQAGIDMVRLSDIYVDSKYIPSPTPYPIIPKKSNYIDLINEIYIALISLIRATTDYIIYIIIIIFSFMVIRNSQKRRDQSLDSVTSNSTDEYGEIKDNEFIYDESVTDEYGEIK